MPTDRPLYEPDLVPRNMALFKDWLHELRTATARKVQMKLKTHRGDLCATGVLCDLFVKRGQGEWTGFTKDCFVFNGIGHYGNPPVDFGRMLNHDLLVEAQHLNDNYDYSFSKIADILEERVSAAIIQRTLPPD